MEREMELYNLQEKNRLSLLTANGTKNFLRWIAADLITLKLITDDDVTAFGNVYVGEVYLFAGQSNIEFKLSDSNTPAEAYKSNEMLRCFEVDKIAKNGLFSPDDGRVSADKNTVYNWSAIGYLAGFEIAETKNVAVGVINCNQGASVIESWVPAGTFEKI